MIEDPLIRALKATPFMQAMLAEVKRTTRLKGLLAALQARFGAVPPAVTAGLGQVKEYERLVRLTPHAVLCPSLQAFEEALREELAAPAPTSKCGKRRARKPSAGEGKS